LAIEGQSKQRYVLPGQDDICNKDAVVGDRIELSTFRFSGWLPSRPPVRNNHRSILIEEIVELSSFRTVEKCVPFLQRVGEDWTAWILGIGHHDNAAAPRHLDATTLGALDCLPPWNIWQ
jgi:hypothetical protein